MRDSIILGSGGRSFSDLRIEQGLLEERKAIDAQAPLTMIASDMSFPP